LAGARGAISTLGTLSVWHYRGSVTITLNGDRFDLPSPLTISELLTHLKIDSRRVAVELNLVVLKRARFDTTEVHDGDAVEIVNFVGGG
jgi:sulfur carrier protein